MGRHLLVISCSESKNRSEKLLPTIERYTGAWYQINKIKRERRAPIDYMAGRIVPHLWQLYLLTDDKWKKARIIYDIMRHNRQCLLKELAIVMMGEGY